jgi:hypothetical protein
MMKKLSFIAVLAIALLMLSSVAFAASVSRNIPARISPGETVQVSLSASGVPVGEVFTIEDTVPQGWLVSNWQVSGAEGDRAGVDYRFTAAENRHGFSFTASSGSPQVSYDVAVPASASGSFAFNAVYFDSSGFNKNDASVTVRTITCGDGVCEGSETTDSCVQDCPAPAVQPPSTAGPEGSESGSGMLWIVLLAVVAAGAFFFVKRSKKK